MNVKSQSIHLPHINYTVRIRPFKKPPGSIAKARAWIKRDDAYGCTLYLPSRPSVCCVAHELTHALRYICIDRHMLFDDESEHMAYLMEYLMARTLGYYWAKSKGEL